MMNLLEVTALSAEYEGKKILDGVSMSVKPGETVVILGPNGAGKSSLARAIMDLGELRYSGKISFDGQDISRKSTAGRARLGMFLAYQNPIEIPGLPMSEALRSAVEAQGRKLRLTDFQRKLADILDELGLNPFAATRALNVGFSGGEKKKLELAQMMMLEPKLAVLDEIDSGLDIDAAAKISEVLANYQRKTGVSYVIVTHNLRILQKLQVGQVYVLKSGKVVAKGGPKLLEEVRKNGFKTL
ncbi:Fe-S cluster assembly ATPase SufC [Candidatus Saccharibacteria bacterium]|nr:Fe-S cluster assembly ATPase SufC [Candidatus Saccharibacteria bacterium]